MAVIKTPQRTIQSILEKNSISKYDTKRIDNGFCNDIIFVGEVAVLKC